MSYCFNLDCPQPLNLDKAKFCLNCNASLLLKDRYRGLKIIGQGGMGRTFLAVDEKNSQGEFYCVVKQLYPRINNLQSLQTPDRFLVTEADIISKLGQHPQIPRFYDRFSQDKYQYLVQEWIEGDNLRQLTAKKGIFSDRGVIHLLNNLLPVLAFVHQCKIIHRDIKPENIICRPNGTLVLVDFGASKTLTSKSLQQIGTTIGSPEYIAPEQLRGKATIASDIYSLGVTCLYLLTGISPFNLYSDSEGTWVWRDYLGNNSIDTKLGHIIDRTIAPTTSKRYQCTQEILQDLNTDGSQSRFRRSQEVVLLKPKIDYTQLKDYLKQQEWEKANQATEKLLLQAANQHRRSWFERDDLANLTCEDLEIINELWDDYSQAHFGFKTQNKVWQNLRVQNYRYFGKEVGWYTEKRWLRMNKLNYSLAAPKGHLPAITWWYGHAIWGLKGLFSKIDACCDRQISNFLSPEQNSFDDDCFFTTIDVGTSDHCRI